MRIETKRLYLRQMTEDDFDLMSLIWMERCSTLFEKLADGHESQAKFLQNMWETSQDPTTLTYLIFLWDGDRFCSRVNMQKTDEKIPELGIDLLGEYQNHGYGPEVITAFANWYGKSRHISEIKVLITAVNTRSAHVFQKLGAEYIQDDPSFFEGRGESGKGPAGKAGGHHGGPARAGIPSETAHYGRFRYRPVTLPGFSATSSGVPAATICPPALPPLGLMSMRESAFRITSRSCLMTTTLDPCSIRVRNTLSMKYFPPNCTRLASCGGGCKWNGLPGSAWESSV